MFRRSLSALVVLCLLLCPAMAAPAAASGDSSAARYVTASLEFRMIRFARTSIKMSLSDEGVKIPFTDNAAGEHPTYTYSSSDPAVAEISPDGVITPKGVGSATVYILSPETESYRSGGDYAGVEVRYDPGTETLILEESPYGSLSVYGTMAPLAGERVIFHASPKNFYVLEETSAFDGDGNAIYLSSLGGHDYSFRMPKKGPVTLRASYRRTLYYEAPEHASVRVSTSLREGESTYLTVSPDDGYLCSRVAIIDANGVTEELRPLRDESGNETEAYWYTVPDALPYTLEISVVPAAASGAPVSAQTDGTPDILSDVPENAWYRDAAEWAVRNGVLGQDFSGPLRADLRCTRAETALMIWRAKGSPAPGSMETHFEDISRAEEWYPAVLWCEEQGILQGVSGTRFAPDLICTRAQIATILWRIHGSSDGPVSTAFQDVPVDAWYARAVCWAAGWNLVNGTGDRRFSPDQECTRAQLLTILYRDMG